MPEFDDKPASTPSSLSDEPQALPVFYDEEKRRWPLFVRLVGFLTVLSIAGLILLVISLFANRIMPRNPLPRPALEADIANPEPILADRQRRKLNYKQEKERIRLQQLAATTERKRRERLEQAQAFLQQEAARQATLRLKNQKATQEPAPAPMPVKPSTIVAGFYVSWDETSRASTHRNITALTHFVPEWLHLKPAGTNFADNSPNAQPFVDRRQSYDQSDITPLVRSHNVPILPLINNYTSRQGAEEGKGTWDTQAVHELVSDPEARTIFIGKFRDWLLKEQMQGANIDFEEIAPEDRDNLVQFMRELYTDFRQHGLMVTQDVQVDSDGFALAELAKWNDWLVPMVYDEHTGETEPGPVASMEFTRKTLQKMIRLVPPAKIVVGVGNHGYDWKIGKPGAANVVYQSAIIQARDGQPDAVIKLDPKSLNPTFTYTDEEEAKHVVWMEDAVSVYNQLTLAKKMGVRGAALWYVGAEDPSLWTFFRRDKWQTDWSRLVSEGALDTVSYGGQAQVDFEGVGELLQPLTLPADGKRRIQVAEATGFISSADYLRDPKTNLQILPSSHVVRRYGGQDGNEKKQIILTFDDGPDPQWTPQVLDILKKYGVKAAFFVVGTKAQENPDLIRRIYDEGHEIGNHSLTHPDLFRLSIEHQRLELTMTQRIIQSITGHSTTLFRPPYGNDVEPETGKEVAPLETAAALGYLTVGQKNDPQDWRLYEFLPGTEALDISKPRPVEEIVQSVLANRNEGSIVLLHDAGGDRSNTLKALPEIITRLRALGYKFMTVSEFRGVSRDLLMPKVSGKDVLLVGGDRYVFETQYWFQRILATLFTLSIVLGISRYALFVGLALAQRRRERQRVFPMGFTPTVSVVIAAYNEEKVIVRTVEALLAGNYTNLEVIVVDDGSKDATSQVVQETFGNDSRVRLITKENGGKATALNRGIHSASGEIIVSLDADTLFASDTVSRLVRHFADPMVGAVSGNVRVGNTHNILTRWQALEYTTSQNFDRRAYDLLNCITVVPGAVGALRREAVNRVGGYTHDTLAEDTDLTWKLRRSGWRIVNDNSAMAYTEAPESLRNLARQRFRWAFGTLQCLWKHRGAVGHHGAFGWLALPSLWLYQILFPAVSPFMDVAVVWSLFTGNFGRVASYYLLMFAVEFVAAFIALRMDRGNLRLLPWLFFQRFLYRQMMYYVIIKSVIAAIRGSAVGWNKFERTGTARVEGKSV